MAQAPQDQPYDPEDLLNPTTIIRRYLMEKGMPSTPANYRKVLEANAGSPGAIPGLTSNAPSTNAEDMAAMKVAAASRGGSGGSRDRGNQQLPIPPIPPQPSPTNPQTQMQSPQNDVLNSTSPTSAIQPPQPDDPNFFAKIIAALMGGGMAVGPLLAAGAGGRDTIGPTATRTGDIPVTGRSMDVNPTGITQTPRNALPAPGSQTADWISQMLSRGDEVPQLAAPPQRIAGPQAAAEAAMATPEKSIQLPDNAPKRFNAEGKPIPPPAGTEKMPSAKGLTFEEFMQAVSKAGKRVAR